MKVIGVTGGVGAGKSTILNILQTLYHCIVIEADKVGHVLMEPGNVNYEAIVNDYGFEILLSDGTIDRKKLAKIAFASKDGTNHLNSLTHPNIHAEIVRQIQKAYVQGYKMLVLEAAMLHQADLISLCDEVWYVHVPAQIRKKRIMDTRGYDEARANAVIALQPSEEEYRVMSTWEIQNDVELCAVQRQIIEHVGV